MVQKELGMMLVDKYCGLKGIKNITSHAGLIIIALVLLISGISKIADPIPMIETVKAFTSLPEELIILGATILPILETSLGLLLLLKIKLKPVMLTTLILFTAFLAFSIYGTIMGMNNDCGCFGSLVKSQIGWGMVGRNFIFAIVLAVILQNEKNLTKK